MERNSSSLLNRLLVERVPQTAFHCVSVLRPSVIAEVNGDAFPEPASALVLTGSRDKSVPPQTYPRMRRLAMRQAGNALDVSVREARFLLQGSKNLVTSAYRAIRHARAD